MQKAENNLYVVEYNGTTTIVSAPNLNSVKAHALKEIQFNTHKAKAQDVADYMTGGGKVVEVAAEAE